MENKLLDLSKIITYQLSKKVKLNKDEIEIIAYQLRVIISEVLGFCVMFLIFMLFGCQWDFVFSYMTMLLSRSYIGGIHRRTFLGCCIHTFIFFTICLVLGKSLPFLKFEFLFPLFCFIDVIFAPCPSKERGQYGKKAKKRMKMFALIGLIICFAICVTFPQYKNIILVTLTLVHVEFVVKYTSERRKVCSSCCVNIS